MAMLALIAATVTILGDCTKGFQNGTDYDGNDLRGGTRSNVTTPQACCALCAAKPGCNAWSLWVSGQQCYLKASGKGSRVSAGHVSGVRNGFPPPVGNCSAWFNSTDGQMCNGLQRTPAGGGSAVACSASCCGEKECSVWVYNTKGQTDRCWTGRCTTPLSGKAQGWVGGATPAPPIPGPSPPPSPGPSPPPTPGPSPKDAYDCAMRSYFIERAAQVNKNIDAARVQQIVDALAGDPGLPAGCVVQVPPALKSLSPRARVRVPVAMQAPAATPLAVFANAAKGSDATGDGSSTNPYRSVGRALTAVRTSRSAPGATSLATINLRAGVYFLDAPLALTPHDSGLTIRTYPGDATAWLSGSVPLGGPGGNQVHWQRDGAAAHANAPAGANIWSADLSMVRGLPADGVRSLRVGGARAILARYPNCNPETSLCFGKGGNTTAASSWASATGHTGPTQYTAPNSTDRNFNCSEQATTKGCDIKYQMNIGGAGCDLLTPNISHFCGGSKVVGATVDHTHAPHQPYADPTGALFSAMHGGSWCSFAYSVGQYTWDPAAKQGRFVFARGGQQCNRMEGQHGPTIIENVLEELDAPSEFFFNRSTKVLTLWYNSTGSATPPADGSIVVPALHTLVSVLGSQARPVTGVSLSGLGFRDTAPTVMLPHTGPSGGDWSVNRYAAVTFEGVAGINITGCTFTRLDNAGVFIGGYARGVVIADNEFAWLGESGVVSLGDTEGSPVPGWGVNGTAGNQPWGTKLWHNYGRELGIINKQSALYFQAVTSAADIRGNVAFNGARSAINFNDCFGTGSQVADNVLFNFNRETADHGPFNSWDRIAFVPSRGPSNRDLLTGNAIWNNFNSANAFDTDDTSTFFHMKNNVQVEGWFLKSDYGGSQILFENNMAINGGQSNQFQAIPQGNANVVKNCTIVVDKVGELMQMDGPCPNGTQPIQYPSTRVYMPTEQGQATVCGKPVAHWQQAGLLKTVAVHALPSTADVVQMARDTLEAGATN